MGYAERFFRYFSLYSVGRRSTVIGRKAGVVVNLLLTVLLFPLLMLAAAADGAREVWDDTVADMPAWRRDVKATWAGR